MIVLHGSVDDARLLAWAETPAAASGPSGRGSPRRSAPSTPLRLPYDAGAAILADVLPSVGSAHAARRTCADAVAWLPTRRGCALASSPLVPQTSVTKGRLVIAPWLVTACALEDAPAVGLLAACRDRVLVPGVIIGPDLAFWGVVLRFAGALVTRERFLPGIRRSNGTCVARWQPVLTGGDAEHLQTLAATMPHACVALTRLAHAGSAGLAAGRATVSPATVLAAFLEEIVDYLVRSGGWQAVDVTSVSRDRGRSDRASIRSASVHDRWLAGLHSPDPRISGTEEELAALETQIAEWRRPVATVGSAALRLCFRLEEPPAPPAPMNLIERPAQQARATRDADRGRDVWTVRYLLQATDDPSLLVPLADVWAGSRRATALVARSGLDPREYVLRSLGQAASICPRVDASLRSPAPDAYELDAGGAYEFLAERAWALQEAGFGVILPSWWTRKGKRPALRARAYVASPMQAAGALSLDALVSVDWAMVLGDSKLSLDEVQALARMKAPLVRIRGQWVEVSPEDREHALRLLKSPRTSMRAHDLVHLVLGAARGPDGLECAGVEAEGWVADVLAQLDRSAAFEELPQPEGFHGTLRPYQVRGYSWLAFLKRWGLGACLADDMGLGKTVQTLALIQREWTIGEKRPALLVCPTSVVGNWQKEAARFTPGLPVMVHHGQARWRGAAFAAEAGKHALVISSYALLHRDLELLRQVEWAGSVLDEAQNIKNPETRQARAARALARGYRVALTGTPVENTVGDLWSIMEFLNPGLLGPQADFKRSFFIPIQVNQDRDATARLKRMTMPFILRRLKTDRAIVADLPEKLEMKVFCNLTREQASLYAAVVAEAEVALEQSEGIQRKGIVLATLSKLKQVCNHPAQFLGDGSRLEGRSGKLARLTEMLDEVIAGGERALVFSQFAGMGALIKAHLQATFGREVLFLHGGVPKPQRDRMIERFQDGRDAPPVFVLSLKAGGTGLNLTAASHVFLFDRWWNPAVEAQAIDRTHRIGQRRNVQAHKFLCIGTLEERIDELIERKKQLASDIIGTGEAWLTELSTAELKQIFALRQDAVAE